MPAKTKAALLSVKQKEFETQESLIEAIDVDVALKKRDDDISIKDAIAHRAHWIELFLGWYADGLPGNSVYFPAEGYKWNDLKRYNADHRKCQSDMDWPAAVALLRTNHKKLIDFTNSCSEDELVGGPMNGANNAWPPGRWAEAARPSHFRSAAKFLRSCLKSTAEPSSVRSRP